MKLNISSKLTAVVIALCIPIVILLYLLVHEKNIAIDFGQKEIYGNDYLIPMRKALQHLPEHKVLSYRKKTTGSVSTSTLATLEASLDQDIKEIEAVEKRHSAGFKQMSKKLNEFKTGWSNLKSKVDMLSVSQSEERHTKLIAALRDLIVYTGNDSNLILDPDLDTFYLMDVTLIKIPTKVDYLFQLQSLAEKIAIKKSITADEKTQLVVLNGLIISNLNDLSSDHEIAYQNTTDKNLKNELTENVSATQNSTNNFLKFINKSMIENNKIEFSYLQVSDLASKAIEASLDNWDNTLRAEDRLIQSRLDRFNNSKISTITWVLLVTIILIALGSYLVSIIVKNIQKLDDAAKKLEAGELGVQVDVKTGDELESLGNSFNSMATNIKNLIVDSEASREDAVSNSINLESLVKETSTSVTQIKQNSEVVSDNARIVAEAASLSVDISSDGEKAVTDSIEGVEQIKTQIEQVATKILELSSQTQAIGKIISTVDDIAKQSRFLAFNASIEASKAGEFGKGFAIVANEIKNLSEESKEATKRISEILNEIQELTNTSVMLTEDATKLADIGVNLSKIAGDTILKLVDSIQNSSDAAYQISSSTIEQKTSLEQLEESMRRISFVSKN